MYYFFSCYFTLLYLKVCAYNVLVLELYFCNIKQSANCYCYLYSWILTNISRIYSATFVPKDSFSQSILYAILGIFTRWLILSLLIIYVCVCAYSCLIEFNLAWLVCIYDLELLLDGNRSFFDVSLSGFGSGCYRYGFPMLSASLSS